MALKAAGLVTAFMQGGLVGVALAALASSSLLAGLDLVIRDIRRT